MDVAAAVGAGLQFFIDGDEDVAAPAGFDLAVVGGQVIAMVVAAAAGVDREGLGRSADVGVRSTGLRNLEGAYGQLSAEVAATGKVHFEVVGTKFVLDIDVAAAMSFQLRELFAGDIGFEVSMVAEKPAEVGVLNIDVEDAAGYFGGDAVAVFGVVGADGDGFFGALVQIEIDSGGDLDGMKVMDIADLGVPVTDDLPVLGHAKEGGEGQEAE